MSDPGGFKPDKGWVRYLGILTGLGLVALAFSEYVLPPRPALFVGALALFFIFIAGSQFLFHSATLVSLALEGQQRRQFQIAVSLAAPLLIAAGLASRADAIPLETLWLMLTPWLLLPLGIIAWFSWYAGTQLHREHPFRGFLIAAGILGALCLFWSAGMTSDSDYDGEGSSLFIDPEKAKEAKATGRYVWQFVLYLATAYLALLLGFRLRRRMHNKAVEQLNNALTPGMAQTVVSKMGGYIADRSALPGREADLPYPKAVIELAFIKAMLGCPDPKYLEILKAAYITLDDYMLSDEDYVILTRFREIFESSSSANVDADGLIKKLSEVDTDRARDIQARLMEGMNKRNATIDKLFNKSG